MSTQKEAQKEFFNDLLFEDDHIRLTFDPFINCVVKEWKTDVNQQMFRDRIIELLMTIVQARMKHPDKQINLLADVRKLGPEVFSEKNMEWLDEKVHKIYEMNKILKKAFVRGDDTAANLNVVQYISQNNSKNKLQMNVFNSMDEAKKWLTA